MKIEKGTKLIVRHKRQGTFNGIAKADFDTEEMEFYPIILDQEFLCGMSKYWERGEDVPCRKSLCEVEVINEIMA